jgi:hypothetical protein
MVPIERGGYESSTGIGIVPYGNRNHRLRATSAAVLSGKIRNEHYNGFMDAYVVALGLEQQGILKGLLHE